MVSSFEARADERWRCSSCLAQDRGGDSLKVTRMVKGCWDLDPNFHKREDGILWKSGNVVYRTCVGNKATPAADDWFTAWRLFENGILPFPGGWMDQPAKAAQILGLIDSMSEERKKRKPEGSNV